MPPARGGIEIWEMEKPVPERNVTHISHSAGKVSAHNSLFLSCFIPLPNPSFWLVPRTKNARFIPPHLSNSQKTQVSIESKTEQKLFLMTSKRATRETKITEQPTPWKGPIFTARFTFLKTIHSIKKTAWTAPSSSFIILRNRVSIGKNRRLRLR